MGEEVVRTKVRLMGAPETDYLDFDIMDFMKDDEQPALETRLSDFVWR
jgi:hypothetical protein